MNYLVGEKKKERVTVGLQEVGEGLYDVTVDGETVRVDLVKSGPTIYSLVEAGRQWEVSVETIIKIPKARQTLYMPILR